MQEAWAPRGDIGARRERQTKMQIRKVNSLAVPALTNEYYKTEDAKGEKATAKQDEKKKEKNASWRYHEDA